MDIATLTQLLGEPCAVATLAAGAPSSTSRLPPGQAWLLLPADAMIAVKMAAGEHVMVAFADQRGAGGASPAVSALTPTSSFAPVAAPSVDARCGVRSLWDLCPAPGVRAWQAQQQRNREEQEQEQEQQEQQQQGGAGTGQQQQQALGRHVLVARAWPAPRLPRATCALSPALMEACGGELPQGQVMLVFRGGSAGGIWDGCCPDAASLVLALCHDDLSMEPVAMPRALPSTTAGANGGRGATPAQSPAGTPRGGGGGDGRGAAGGQGGAAPALNHPMADWPLRLLRGGGGSGGGGGGGGSDGSSSSGGGVHSGSSSSGSSSSGGHQRALLSRIASQHLSGRPLLPGNPVCVPLMGRTLVFEAVGATVACAVAGAGQSVASGQGAAAPELGQSAPLGRALAFGAGAPSPGQSAAPGQAQACAPWRARPVTVAAAATQLTLLLPGDAHPTDASAAGAGGGGSRAAGGGGGGRSGGGARVPRGRPARRRDLCGGGGGVGQRGGGGGGRGAACAVIRVCFDVGGLRYAGGFDTLGGVSEYVPALRQLVSLPLRAPQLFAAYGVRPPRGVLLHGPPGTGKTLLARAAAADAGATLLLLNGPDVVSEFLGESEAGLRGVFAAARALKPAVIFIDEIDALAPSRGNADGGGGGMAAALTGSSGGECGVSARLVTALLTLMDGGGGADGDGVVVVGATNRPEALDAALRRPGRFERELEIGVPGPSARLDILRTRLRAVSHALSPWDEEELARAAHGFVGADLAALVDEAAMVALRRFVSARHACKSPESPHCALVVGLEDFKVAETRVRPSAMREVSVEVPNVSWDDVGGLDTVKERLKEVVEWPVKYADALARVGARPPRGVLLYGPPGCSKTLLARAVASQAGLNFLSIKGGELFSKFVGESEKAISSLFARARAASPSVIFFDEIDALAGTRGDGGDSSGTGGLGDRVLSQLLMEMDGLQARARVIVLAATNRPDRVDPALLRPGRFDRLVHVPPPDGAGRAAVLVVHTRHTPMGEDVDLGALAQACTGYSGADLAALVREAALAALQESLDADVVAARHFEAARALVPASAAPSAAMQAVFARFQASGQQHARQ
ncbi:hypothetical protein FOA52_005875 [Chlamydomonas sp. UWO 241]|nr:hypothetical protein FOA52_005875 [Chlamydomonas sp. UWO 241]